ncbi:MAG: hypothetical protein MI810_22855 [Flavobacteriales bacterium]|nr:hypothetical protein [Flavobacteriales bacterium]
MKKSVKTLSAIFLLTFGMSFTMVSCGGNEEGGEDTTENHEDHEHEEGEDHEH